MPDLISGKKKVSCNLRFIDFVSVFKWYKWQALYSPLLWGYISREHDVVCWEPPQFPHVFPWSKRNSKITQTVRDKHLKFSY
jgi:hypothetical protein